MLKGKTPASLALLHKSRIASPPCDASLSDLDTSAVMTVAEIRHRYPSPGTSSRDSESENDFSAATRKFNSNNSSQAESVANVASSKTKTDTHLEPERAIIRIKTSSYNKYADEYDAVRSVPIVIKLEADNYKKHADAFDAAAAAAIHVQLVEIENAVDALASHYETESGSINSSYECICDAYISSSPCWSGSESEDDCAFESSKNSNSDEAWPVSSSQSSVSDLTDNGDSCESSQHSNQVQVYSASPSSSSASNCSSSSDDDYKITRSHSCHGDSRHSSARPNISRFSPYVTSSKSIAPKLEALLSDLPPYTTRAPSHQPEYPPMTYSPWYEETDGCASPPYLPEDINMLNPELDPDDDNYYIQEDPSYVDEVDFDHDLASQKF